MPNYKLTVSYNGTDFLGWQRHGDKPTIQYALEQAMTKVFNARIAVKGSGRTDRGAHANGQVINAEIETHYTDTGIKTKLNDALPDAIKIAQIEMVADDFDACDSAIGKRYRFVIWNDRKLPSELNGLVWHVTSELHVDAMIDACSVFVGEHDFASFAKRPNFKQKSTTRTVTSAVMQQDGQRITFDICADGFLYKMVRNIMRAIVKVGEGRYNRDELCRILEAKDRKAAPGTAPASGLYLEKVYYTQDELLADAKEGTLQ